MQRIFTGLILLAVVACAVSAAFLSMAVNRSADVLAVGVVDAMNARDPMDDLIASRESAPATNRSSAGWIFAFGLLLFIVVIGGMILTMQAGTPFLKQLRGLRRPTVHHRPVQHPAAIQWTEPVANVPQLPLHTNEESEWVN